MPLFDPFDPLHSLDPEERATLIDMLLALAVLLALIGVVFYLRGKGVAL